MTFSKRTIRKVPIQWLQGGSYLPGAYLLSEVVVVNLKSS
jgi:hypothetical protein